MSVFKSYLYAPNFYTDMEFSASDYNVLRNNAELLKAAATHAEPIHYIHRTTGIPRTNWIWRGGFQYKTGLTTARFIIYSIRNVGSGVGHIQVYFNGVQVASISNDQSGSTYQGAAGFATVDIALGALGYTDEQIITVEITHTNDPGDLGNVGFDDTFVFDAYTFPVSSIVTESWPGLPSFGSTLSSSGLNQLAAAENWLVIRNKIIPIPLAMSFVNWQGTQNPAVIVGEFFTTRATNANNRLYGTVYYICNVDSGKVRVTIGGINFDYGPYTKGTANSITIDIDIIAAGLGYDVDYYSLVRELIITPDSGDVRNRRNSRISIGPLYMGASSYSMSAGPSTFSMLEVATYGTVQSNLNTISSQLAAVKATIDANPRVYDRAHMFRGRFVLSAEQNEFWEKEMIASGIRQADILWVKGQGLKIAYGPIEIKATTDDEKWDYKFLNEIELTAADKIEQRYFYFDQFPSLYPGQTFYIIGKDLIYCAQQLVV